jgi:hypothetical protein
MMSTLDYASKEVATVTGSPADVRKSLAHIQAEQVVALALAHATPREAAAIAETIASIAKMVPAIVERNDPASLEQIVEALVPKAPPTPNELKEAAMLARARTAVLQSGDWMTAAEIAQVAGFSSSNPSAQPNKWKRDGAIFAIRHNGVDYFPSYGLDPKAGYRPLKSMAKVIDIFRDAKDGWGMSYWFASVNSFLGGKRPQELLAAEPERVLAAARDALEEVAHG